MADDKDEVKSTEYPKSLYRDGDRNGEHRIVQDDDEERAARKDGFKMIDKDYDAAAVKRLGAEPAEAVDVEQTPAPKKKAKAK
jgi:hypothetical protein